MVGLASIGNAVGRVFLGVDFRFDHQTSYILRDVCWPGSAVLVLPKHRDSLLETIVTFAVLMCYGGGFGTMPAFAADYFGPKNVGPIYGLMLTPWGFASVFGPLLIAHMRETAGSYRGALHLIAGIMAISTLLPLLVRPPRTGDTGAGKKLSYQGRVPQRA